MSTNNPSIGQRQEQSLIPLSCSIPGKHSYSVRGVPFTVDAKYKIIKPIGVGAYGLVLSAVDRHTGEMVAIKKISGVFDDLVDAKRVLREVRLMRILKHENILPLIDMEAPESLADFKDVYMTMPLYDKDLSKILAAKVALSREHKQYFIFQILYALKYLHRSSILHRDLKPANILIQESCDLAICDFGLARYIDENAGPANGMTEYVVTRWYRAPELVLTHSYTSAVDLWAVGCILGELLAGTVVFPGRDFKHQVETICEVLGKPKGNDVEHVTSGRARKFLENLPEGDGRKYDEMFGEADQVGVDLMRKLLKFDPKKRLSAAEALTHEYVRDFFDEDEQDGYGYGEGMVGVGELEPKGDLGTEELKRLMLNEIRAFRPDAKVFGDQI